MGDVVNLRGARKKKARTEAEATAARNRAKFGRHKADRTARSLEEARARKELDGKRLGPDAPDKED